MLKVPADFSSVLFPKSMDIALQGPNWKILQAFAEHDSTSWFLQKLLQSGQELPLYWADIRQEPT